RSLQLWDTATGVASQTHIGHSSSANSVAFSLNGKQVASGSKDPTVRLWGAVAGA
ncbi:uncharacterized protein BKA55DRAFT_488706, partial [Fusarium redolens]